MSANSSPHVSESAGVSGAGLGALVHYLYASLVVALLVLLYAPTMRLLGKVWWTDESYSHGLVVPLVLAFIIWTQRRKLARVERRPALLGGGALIMLALLLLRVGVIGPINLLQYASLFLMLAGVTLYRGGLPLLRALAVPFVLLALSLPLPTVVMNSIAAPLQLLASQCAVWAMRLFQIPLVQEGNVIQMVPLGALKIEKLEVVQACSGVRSLFSLIFMAVLFVFFTQPRARAATATVWWRRYGFWRALVLVAAAVPIAVLSNVLRVSGTGVLSYYYGLQVATGFFHSFAGVITYSTAAVLLLCSGWLLGRIHKRTAARATATPGPLTGAQR